MLFLIKAYQKIHIIKNKRYLHAICKSFQDDIIRDNIEKLYQKKSLLEHILHRPDSYVGAVSRSKRNVWVYDEFNGKIIEKEISFSPALYKIYDEILVNAVDNKLRDSVTSYVKINVNKDANIISISNDGPGIPVIVHREENVYVPSMIFGQLLTSSNYDDSQDKFTGGRNGFGAKLCNLFSDEFTVETSNAQFGSSFRQTWKKNMTIAMPPIITPSKSSDYTTVTFSPDLSRFGMHSLDSDIISLFQKRAFDIASCTKDLDVYFNDTLIPVHSFKDYVQLYPIDDPTKIVYKEFNENWQVAVTMSPNEAFSQVSFVNGVNTSNGGQHVNSVTDPLSLKLLEIVKRRMKDWSNVLKPHHLKNCLWVFINCYIKNPTFESQSKECMTLLPKQFGSVCDISEEFARSVANCGILEKLETTMTTKRHDLLTRLSGKKTSSCVDIEKLDDAILAGGRHSRRCTLILTEGDSAKTLALSGLSVIGRDYYGVYPLKGKLLNVRDSSVERISSNNEFKDLAKILGLKYHMDYSSDQSLDSLRYGRVMIMADQDPDGSHIKGLIINYLHFHWPPLLGHGFIEQFITPLMKAFKNESVRTFFSRNEYDLWRLETPDWQKWRIKYYKGLGTSTNIEAKEYFANIDRHRIPFVSSELDDEKLKMAFDRKLSHSRKLWLLKWMEERKDREKKEIFENDIYDKRVESISYSDFVDKELVQFSNADNERSIPSLMDGLKTGQRKIIYTCLKRNLTKEIKVAQLAGSVAELSSYHHGEMALHGTIIGLAQDYVGSNNINLLKPVGQFGTRVFGGKDNACARYIFTQLSPLTRYIFHPMDDPILSYLMDNNQSIEPQWYAPVIPLILVNGCEGIGTGWRSLIPNFNPFVVIDNIRRMLENKEPLPMKPWYRNFKGTIEQISSTQCVSYGKIEQTGPSTVIITELPLKCWTQQYKKKVLNKLSENYDGFVKKYEEHNSDTEVKIIIHMNPSMMERAESIGLLKLFKLKTYISTNEMILFDELGRIRKFSSAEEILTSFYRVRLEIYDKRKMHIERILMAESRKWENQARFIKENIEGKICLHGIEEGELKERLINTGYESDPIRELKKEATESSCASPNESSGSFDLSYLINLPLRSLTVDNVNKLEKIKDCKLNELQLVQNKTSKELWMDDLRLLEEEIESSGLCARREAA